MSKIFSIKKIGIFGIISPLIALIAISISILLHPWFSWADNALSDLGALSTSYNIIFNLGLVLSGATGLLFTLGLRQLFNSRIEKIGGLIFGLGVLSLVLVGVFPEGTSPHWLVSVAFFALSTLGMVIIGIGQLRRRSYRIWGIFVLSIVITALASVLLIMTIPYDLGPAIPETIGAIAFSEFSIVFGARLIGIFNNGK